MAGERQLTKTERDEVQRKLNEIRASISPSPPKPPAGWQKVADLLNRSSEGTGDTTSAESLRKMGDYGDGGIKIARMVRRHLGEALEAADRFVDRTERYHTIEVGFTRARAAGVQEAILDAARLTLGVNKTSEPTLDEVRRVIRDEIEQVKRDRELYSAEDVDALPAERPSEVGRSGIVKKDEVRGVGAFHKKKKAR